MKAIEKIIWKNNWTYKIIIINVNHTHIYKHRASIEIYLLFKVL